MIEKNLFQCLLFLFLLFTSAPLMVFPQWIRQTDQQILDLSKNVNTVHQRTYNAIFKDGKVIKGKKLINSEDHDEVIVFNKNGFKVSDTYFSKDDEAKEKYEFTYDSKMNIVGAYYYVYYNGYDYLVYKNKFNYEYFEDKVYKEQLVDQYGNVIHNAFCKYDKSGNMCEKKWYKTDSSLIRNFTRNIDDNRNLVTEKIYSPDGKELHTVKYKYDLAFHLSEKEICKGKKLEVKYKFTYDQYNKIIETDWCKENGDVFKKITYQYEYDDEGNWIRMIHFINDEVTKVTERQIFYNIQ